MSISLQRIVLIFLILVFFGLILSVYSQYRTAWENLDTNLGESLTLEGEELATWITRSFFSSFDFDVWSDSPDPGLFELTGSNWALVNEEGELVTDTNGAPFYEYPTQAYSSITSGEDLPIDQLKSVLSATSTVLGDLRQVDQRFVKRVFVPIQISSEILTENWVLVGQAGEGYFAELFEQQRSFWWIASTLSLASAIFVILLFRGITRTERLEKNLRDAEEQIQLESLTSTLAHELRNPLSIIQSTAEILRRDEPLSEDGKGLIADVIEEVQRSQDVLSRHLHPERRAPEKIEDLSIFLKDYWKRRGALLETKQLKLESIFPGSSETLGVVAVPDQLEQILDNLMRNSSEAMPEGGRIRLELFPESDRVNLIFTDNGPGLKGFGTFWRDGWRMESSKAEGRGIGLRLASRWVASWGGELEARTLRSGMLGSSKGTEVRISLKRTP